MKKRRHHHVWKAYLRAWATKDKLAVLQGGRIRSADINDVGVQRDFYKLHALTPAEISYIRKFWIEPSSHQSHRLHEQTLFMFTAWPLYRSQLTEAQADGNPELVAFLDEQILNAEEEFHSGWESRAAPLIEAARRGDISFYADAQNAILISHFMALQHFRTAAMRQRAVERLKIHMGIDISRCWNVMAHIFAANVGFSLFSQRKMRPLALLDNKTALPFITGDQPTVNLLSNTRESAPDHLALYYPVSPRFALLLDDTESPCGIAEAPLTEDVVSRLNAAELRAAERQVFASSPNILEQYLRSAA